MNAMFDTVRFVHSLENEGISRGAAEAIAQGFIADRKDLATKDDIERLRTDMEKYATKVELTAALTRQVVQFGIMLFAGLTLAVAAVGVIVSIR